MTPQLLLTISGSAFVVFGALALISFLRTFRAIQNQVENAFNTFGGSTPALPSMQPFVKRAGTYIVFAFLTGLSGIVALGSFIWMIVLKFS